MRQVAEWPTDERVQHTGTSGGPQRPPRSCAHTSDPAQQVRRQHSVLTQGGRRRGSRAPGAPCGARAPPRASQTARGVSAASPAQPSTPRHSTGGGTTTHLGLRQHLELAAGVCLALRSASVGGAWGHGECACVMWVRGDGEMVVEQQERERFPAALSARHGARAEAAVRGNRPARRARRWRDGQPRPNRSHRPSHPKHPRVLPTLTGAGLEIAWQACVQCRREQ